LACQEGFEAQKGAFGARKYPDGELKPPFEELEDGFIGEEGGVIAFDEGEELELEARSAHDGVEEGGWVGAEYLAEQDFA